MKATVDSVEISEENITAIVRIQAEVGNVSGYRVVESIEAAVIHKLAERILIERGPAILEKITDNQLINATIMRVAGSIGGGER